MGEVSKDELRRCIELLERLADQPTLVTEIPEQERVALLTAAGRVSRPTRHEKVRVAKAFRKVVRKRARAHDTEARAQTEIRAARRAEVFTAPPRLVAHEANGEIARELERPRACYVCKAEYKKLHFFYDALCPECAALNYEKRFQTAPLEGRTALITGARVKIGYQAALKMLRAGARVIVTTRFPRDAAQRYASEPDYETFCDRLEIHPLDLRHCPSVEIFCRYLCQTRDRLDILINNAAQTVRRPPGFYTHLLELESRPIEEVPEKLRLVLGEGERLKAALGPALRDAAPRPAQLAPWGAGEPAAGIRAAAALSQIRNTDDDDTAGIFPAGKLDADLQQVDLRTMNSWRMTLGEVSSAEMLEVQLINSVAPFILASRLKPLMLRKPTGDRHIVNVSAMEGQFSRHTKTDKHPHTNMAKAALNMMTLTSAPDYAKDGIFMNAVDTGWVTDEDPALIAARKQREHDFQPPLDIVDGAARVCDPFFSGLLTGEHVWGKFLKDYVPVSW
jgi:NAD(P)-dependent dehydrogenase (short-subunit alcohol dehydrogenase family)